MPDQYYVVIFNQSGDVKNYLLFNDPPDEGSLGTPYSNVWLRSNGVFSPNGRGKFSIGTETFAVCGTTSKQEAFGLKVQIDTSDNSDVTLSTRDVPGTSLDMEIIHDGAGFVPPGGTTTLPGSFGIQTGAFSARQYTHVWCGMGKYNNKGKIVPVVSWQAKPTMNYTVTPITKFWVATGTFEDGLVVDKTIFGAMREIDFTGANGNMATVTHLDDGTYTEPEFSWST